MTPSRFLKPEVRRSRCEHALQNRLANERLQSSHKIAMAESGGLPWSLSRIPIFVSEQSGRLAAPIQEKPKIGAVDDPLEHEADRLADRAVRMPDPTGLVVPQDDRTEASRQRAANGAEPSAVAPIVHEVLRSPGQALDPATRAFFEPRFGHDFGQVRVHFDQKAAESAQELNALAYTVGKDVVFAQGEFQPWTTRGRQLIAHELAHTLQQGTTTSKSGSLRVSSPVDSEEQAADRMAARVASGRTVSAVAAVTPPALQRQQASTDRAGLSSQPVSGEARLIASFDVDPVQNDHGTSINSRKRLSTPCRLQNSHM
jgi:hypothetical protein